MISKLMLMVSALWLLIALIKSEKFKHSSLKTGNNDPISIFKKLKNIEKTLDKKKANRNFGLLDKNLYTPAEYNQYRKLLKYRQRIEQEKIEKAERHEKIIRDKIFRKYLLPRVGGSFLRDFNARF